jgi:hypothetical protein
MDFYSNNDDEIKKFLTATYSWLKHNSSVKSVPQEYKPNNVTTHYRVSKNNVCSCCSKLKAKNGQIVLEVSDQNM